MEQKQISKERDSVIYDTIYYAVTKYIKPEPVTDNMEEPVTDNMEHTALTCLNVRYSDINNNKERIDSIFKEFIDKFINEGYIYNIEGNEALYNNPNKSVNLDQQSVKVELYDINPITLADVLGL